MTQAARRESGREMQRSMPRVGSRIELEAEPGEPLADAASDRRGVLADAAGEDETVDAAHGGRERRRLAQDAIDEVVDGKLRQRLPRRPAGRACRC